MMRPAFSHKQRQVLTWWMPGSGHYEKEAIPLGHCGSLYL